MDGDDYFEFQCDDEVMHRRGGIYKFYALDIATFGRETCRWISHGEEIADCCKTTEELHEWYLKHWTYNREDDYIYEGISHLVGWCFFRGEMEVAGCILCRMLF